MEGASSSSPAHGLTLICNADSAFIVFFKCMNGIKEVLDIVTVVSYYGYWLMDHNVDQQSKTNLGYKCMLYLDNTGRRHQWKKSSIQLI